MCVINISPPPVFKFKHSAATNTGALPRSCIGTSVLHSHGCMPRRHKCSTSIPSSLWAHYAFSQSTFKFQVVPKFTLPLSAACLNTEQTCVECEKFRALSQILNAVGGTFNDNLFDGVILKTSFSFCTQLILLGLPTLHITVRQRGAVQSLL